MTESKLGFVPTYERLPLYLHVAEQALQDGKPFISGTEIADDLCLSPIQVRKDLSFACLKGIPKRGYKTAELISGIRSFLTWDTTKPAIVIGAGNLGKALILHDEFKDCGLNIVGIFDNDKRKIGKKIGTLEVCNIEQLESAVKNMKPWIAVLTLSEKANVQELASALAENGIKGIWNFTKQRIVLDADVAVYDTDLCSSFAVLCADMQRRK